MSPFAAVHETHVGVVLLLGERAYKMKKPVRTDFLDFSTIERRRAACRREVELNRRLAPDVYLGLGELTTPDGSPAEPVVVMRRMPPQRRLAALVTGGAPVEGALRELAQLLAAFHARAARTTRVRADGTAAALRARWDANLAELAPYTGTVLTADVVEAVGSTARRFLDGRDPLLQDRLDHDRIVDGHGDLLADDVFCLDDGPRVLDCLEFDDGLRHVDGLDDAAFLAMDLDRLGRLDLAARFLDDYAEFADDPAPVALRDHFIAYRAVVRAKVACLRHRQGDPAAAHEARLYAGLALRRLESAAVRLVLVGGLPGTGKTTLGGALADRIGAVLLSSDRLRKELAGLDPGAPAGAGYREGLYTREHTDAVYGELLHRAGVLLARGGSVVLDASWGDRRHRRDAGRLAEATASGLVQLECRVSPDIARDRIVTRPRTASDATAPIAVAMAAEADPWPEATPVPTGGSPEESLDRAVAAWRAAAGSPR